MGSEVEMMGTPGVAKRMLYAGVTGFLDLFNAEGLIFALRKSQQEGHLPGARIFAAGPCLTATNGHCSEYGIPTRLIDSPSEAREQVADLAAKEPDVVKIVYDHTSALPTIELDTLRAAIETANELGLKTVIHIGSWQDALDSVRAGASLA